MDLTDEEIKKIEDEWTKQHKVKFSKVLIRGFDFEGHPSLNQYSVLGNLGEGSFENSEGINVTDGYDLVIKEIDIMKSLNHPNVIRLHEVINPPNEEDLLLVIDYAKYGEIMSWNEETHKFVPCSPDNEYFTEREIQKLARDIVRGIDYLHKKKIIHRDIKPQNIFLDENGIAEIGDYGCALKFPDDDDFLTDTKGTYYFLSPETCDTSVKKWSGKPVDIWAFGITLYAMTFNEVPFISDTVVGILDQILHTKLNFKNNRNISEGLEDLILRCLDPDPKTRITIEELKKNPWINEGFICPLDSPESHFISHITEDDLNKKSLPIYAVLFVKRLGRLWRKRNEAKLKSNISSLTVAREFLEMSKNQDEEDNSQRKQDGYHPNMCKIASSNPLSEVLEGDAPLASIRENLSNDELQEDIRIEKRGSQEGEFLQSSAKGFSNLKLVSIEPNDSSISESSKLPPIQNKKSIEILPLESQ